MRLYVILFPLSVFMTHTLNNLKCSTSTPTFDKLLVDGNVLLIYT